MNRSKIVFCLLCILLAAPVLSEDQLTQNNPSEYISVTFEINGLDESAQILKEAMATLSLSINEAAKSPENLTVEQIRELEKLADKSDQLVLSLERTLKEVNPAISNATQPTKDLLSALLHTTKTEAVDPAIKSIKDTVQLWMLIVVIGGAVIVALIGVSFYSTIKQFRDIADALKSISGEYEIVRRKD